MSSRQHACGFIGSLSQVANCSHPFGMAWMPSLSTLGVHDGVAPSMVEHAPIAANTAVIAAKRRIMRWVVGMGLLLLDRERDGDVHGDAAARGRRERLPAEAAEHARGDLVRVDAVCGQRGAADL